MVTKKRKSESTDRVKIFGPSILLTIVGFIFAYQFVDPAPPKRVVIGTGSRQGAYYAYGKAYSEILAGNGITLEVRSTAGSAENIKLIESKSNGVDIAFVQGGMAPMAKTKKLVSLGSLYFEPLWIFQQTDFAFRHLSDLKGLRVAVGVEGSGTKILAMQLLGLNGITPKNTQILSDGGQQASDRLLNGELDVAFFVTTYRSAHLKKLLMSRSVKLMSLERAEAYALRYHYLYVFKLPEGVFDFDANIPSHDLTLVAPATQLVVRSDLHPALTNLLLQAAEKIHGAGGGFEKEGEFPSRKYLDFELSEEAKRFYKSGSPFLQRYLPFWVANFLERMKVMLLPLMVLLFPLFKLMPPIYRWRIRSKIYRWYSKLATIDFEAQKKTDTAQFDEYLSELEGLEETVSQISVPLAFAEELYHLRLHIDMLRNRLQQKRQREIRE